MCVVARAGKPDLRCTTHQSSAEGEAPSLPSNAYSSAYDLAQDGAAVSCPKDAGVLQGFGLEDLGNGLFQYKFRCCKAIQCGDEADVRMWSPLGKYRDPTSLSADDQPTIEVVSASYGGDRCSTPSDEKSNLAKACDEKPGCSYKVGAKLSFN